MLKGFGVLRSGEVLDRVKRIGNGLERNRDKRRNRRRRDRCLERLES